MMHVLRTVPALCRVPLGLSLTCLFWSCTGAAICAGEERPAALVGYTELRADLPGGRHANVCTMRAMVVRPDGGEQRTVAADLAREPNTWTQFAGWSPDGKTAIIGRGWESPENAQW